MTLKFRGDVRRVSCDTRRIQEQHLPPTGMGQEAGKPAWPKTAGGYQTISGRRYGRRHAYVSFRPITEKQRPTSTVDSQNMEMNSGHKDQAMDSKSSVSSVLQNILPMASSNSVRSELNTPSNQDARRKLSSLWRVTKPPANHSKRPKSDQVVPYNHCNIETNEQERVWPITKEKPKRPEVLSYINIDAYEPDSSGAEEEDSSSNPSHAIHERLNRMIDNLEDNADSLDDLHSNVFTFKNNDTECLAQAAPTELYCDEPQRTVKENIDQLLVCEDQAHGVTAGAGSASCQSTGNVNPEELLVVRPKIRKQTSETHLERRKHSDKREASHLSDTTVRNKCGSAPPGFLGQTSPESDFLFDFPPMALSDLNSFEKKPEDGSNAAVGGNDDNVCEGLEDPSVKGERSSSECSEGEWSASWTSDSGLEKDRSSSEESWETLPSMDELPGSNNSSQEEVPSLSLALEEQTPLEEGEIPWLMYNEDSGTSSDEEADGVSHFVHPGLFILDGNNNLEDDSSVSEDLDTEWRFLDEFGDGFGMAQAISYVDHSQLLTYMALEERLAQAMEAALAHLESLAIDVEQAQPPATEQIIDCLPQITIRADNTEQEQCCAICCCEYVNDEIATHLPCRHMFHKLCITLWLRKSGTCPVCRHVLTPAVTEPTSLNPEHETPPSSHNASGGTC
ncbi:E3 ubiquitin-protein ligase Praja-2 isoform X2 [Triplophysa rosa]|uniref:E3 ubiquitin-protein ligase Praja-2 isoform X2 n=1 Tax=Triplophysa rosa TaxID=992332 RepID=UPI00254636E0|nr:E3 ubiquitin-protein ligase Praja-2 isoform X2 [Triplophysa rosa]